MMRTQLRQTVSIVEFFSSLGAGAVIIWIVWKLAVSPMTYIGDNAQLAPVQRSFQWTEILLNNLPIMFAIIAVVGSIAFVVYQTGFT